MNTKAHYDKLYAAAISQIATGNCQIDFQIDSNTDNRFGITLLIRPSIAIKNKIQEFLNELKELEPKQYYYPNTDIHITVMSIISCYENFDLTQIKLSEYVALIQKSLITYTKIKIQFKGVTASPSCLMIQGFMNNENLNTMRNELRFKFKNSTLEQSIDARYAIQTAHSTVVRFKEELQHKTEFLKVVEKYRHTDFGTFNVDKVELVYNDWYQKKKHVKVLHEFEL